MSVESSEALERSVLEGKDRDALLRIAEALGVKAGSRAKKAEIVDRILEQTGAAGSGSKADDAASAPKPAGRGRGAKATAPVEVEVEHAVNGEGPDAEPRAEWEVALEAEGGDATAEPSAGVTTEAPPQRDRDGGQSRDNRDNRDRQGGGDRQGGDRQEGEPGNRRRRRRGRDRDRDRQGGDRQGGDRQGGQGGDRQGADRQGGEREEQPWVGEPIEVAGLLDLRDEGYGFLRINGYLPSRDDVYVSVKQARQFGLRKGDHLTGASRPAGRNERNPALLRIDTVNGVDPEQARQRPRFEDLTPLFPDEKLRLEVDGDPTNMTARIIDLISPIGKGQRGLIVSPPKAGKTTIIKQIARSIETNNPEVHLMVLQVDERPEEVTDMRRWVKGEVVASTFDRPSDEHTMVAELAIERAKRLVESGGDVVVILDGITRLARAYNLAAPATGRIMSGGIDTGALYPPKKFFGAARNIEEGGSLTILATALVETGSRMDEVIFEEFKGTGNMELRLDRKLSERRIYPAIDVDASSTRHEELLFQRNQLQQVWKLRRVLSGLGEGGGGAGLELLTDRMKTFKSNDDFLAEIAKAPSM
ncbi:MAG TPA: transcription termination factor Rho [Acidimicrobiales bacterium]|nr:transcription termination factor Rho [Acidimicrobiales bacterium]